MHTVTVVSMATKILFACNLGKQFSGKKHGCKSEKILRNYAVSLTQPFLKEAVYK